MSDDTRNWRDAKMPQWAKDAVQAEIDACAMTAALAWPTEAKPAPVPFRWGEYDRLFGTPVEGLYFTRFGEAIHIKRNNGEIVASWKNWAFSTDGQRWTASVCRGPLFATARDAKLYALWLACEDCAKKLMTIRKGLAQ